MSHFWITSECLGVGQVKNSAPSKSHNLIPWACVAAYLHSVKVDRESSDIPHTERTCETISDVFEVPASSIQDRKNFEGRAFCFFYHCRSVLVFQHMLMHILNCHQIEGISGLAMTWQGVEKNARNGTFTCLKMLLPLLMVICSRKLHWNLVHVICSFHFGQLALE